MSNNNMNFVQSDLLLRYVKSDKAICFDGIHNNNYVIVLCLGGRIKIEYSNRIYFMKSGDIFLADRREEYQIYYGGIESEFLEIRFQAKFFHNLDKETERERTEKSFFVPKDEIVSNDYDLSINKYKKTEYKPVEYPSTAELMTDLHELEMQITAGLAELEEML